MRGQTGHVHTPAPGENSIEVHKRSSTLAGGPMPVPKGRRADRGTRTDTDGHVQTDRQTDRTDGRTDGQMTDRPI